MIHQPLAGMEGTAEDIMIHAKEFKKIKQKLNQILIKHTGHPLEQIEQDTDRDRFMSAEEALEYKLIDQVIEHMEAETDRESRACRLDGGTLMFASRTAIAHGSGERSGGSPHFPHWAVRDGRRKRSKIHGRIVVALRRRSLTADSDLARARRTAQSVFCRMRLT